jgi:hypothetical protein
MTEETNKTVALTTEPPPQAAQQLQLQMQITPQGIQLLFPMSLGLDNETVKQLIKAYLQQHPELMQEILHEALAQKQQEQKFLQLVKQSRND